MQSVLTFHRFHICEFQLLKFTVNPKLIFTALLQSFMDVCTVVKNLSCLMCMFQAEVKQGDTLPSCFRSHTVNKCPFLVLFSATSFVFMCFWLVTLLFKMAPSSVLKCCLVFLRQQCYHVPNRKRKCQISLIQA